jgi:hypothetical protein
MLLSDSLHPMSSFCMKFSLFWMYLCQCLQE